jgi:hypothetical protein
MFHNFSIEKVMTFVLNVTFFRSPKCSSKENLCKVTSKEKILQVFVSAVCPDFTIACQFANYQADISL